MNLIIFISAVIIIVIIIRAIWIFGDFELMYEITYLNKKSDFLKSQKIDEMVVLEKFKNGLFKIIEQENIKFSIVGSCEELNSLMQSPAEDSKNYPCGLYTYFHKDTLKDFNELKLECYYELYPKIRVVKQKSENRTNLCSYVMTIAHELGHHFCINEKDDYSENGADNYILEFARRILTKQEILSIGISLFVYSNTPEEEFYKEFKKENFVYTFEQFLKEKNEIWTKIYLKFKKNRVKNYVLAK